MLGKIKELAGRRRVNWKKHALRRMLERQISRERIFATIADGEVIEEHELERPLVSYLVLGYYNKKPLHVMLAVDSREDILWIITVYKPSSSEWHEDMKTRRKP